MSVVLCVWVIQERFAACLLQPLAVAFTPTSPSPSPPLSTYINGSPQNTFVPGVVELAQQKKVFLAGDDFKSGQTKIKSVLVDFLVSAGLKVS